MLFFKKLILYFTFFLFFSCEKEAKFTFPSEKSIYFPIDIQLSPDQENIFILNSNFDQKYSTGWLSVLSIESLFEWIDSPQTNKNFLQSIIKYELYVPSLGGNLTFSLDGTMGAISSRLGVLTLFEIDSSTSSIHCGEKENKENVSFLLQATDCDAQHLKTPSLTNIENDLDNDNNDDLELDDSDIQDPFAITFIEDLSKNYLITSYLNSGIISIFDIDMLANTPIKYLKSIYTGLSGINSFHLQELNDKKFIFATPNNINGLMILDSSTLLDDSNNYEFFSFDQISSLQPKNFTFKKDHLIGYSIANFDDDINLVLSLDTSLHTQNKNTDISLSSKIKPKIQELGVKTLSGELSDIIYIERMQGDLLAITDFEDNEIYILDPIDQNLNLVAQIKNIGSGPLRLIHLKRDHETNETSHYLLVTTFYDHSITVIDITSEPSQFKKIAHIQFDEQ